MAASKAATQQQSGCLLSIHTSDHHNPHVMDRIYSPLQLFQLFFTGSVVDTIVKNTNAFARKRSEAGKRFVWLPLKVQELYSFIGLVIYMGLLGAKNIIDYWSGKEMYRLPFPKSVLSRSRFQAISWNLHLCDPEDDLENARKKGTPVYDKLFKIKPLYTDIITACKTYFHPDRQLAVDERMVASKARIGIKQYMKDKPSLFMKANRPWPLEKGSVMILLCSSWICLFLVVATSCLWTTSTQAHAFSWTCWPRRPWRVAQYALIGKAFQKQKQMISVGQTQGEPYDGLEMGSCFFSSGRTHVKLQCAQPCTRLMAVRQSLGVSKIQMAVGK